MVNTLKITVTDGSRAPHGARGLKYFDDTVIGDVAGSRPARGAWIEMRVKSPSRVSEVVAPRTGRVD